MSNKQQLLLLCVASAWLIGCNQHSANHADREQHAVPAGEVGSLLPDFSVTDLRGHALSTADIRGKVVIVDFWATWCGPCKKEMPGYQALLDRYGPRGLAVVGLKFDNMKDTEEPLKFANRIGVRYPLAVATDDLNQKFGGIEGLPTTIVYDRMGILRKKIIGFEYTSVFEAELKSLL